MLDSIVGQNEKFDANSLKNWPGPGLHPLDDAPLPTFWKTVTIHEFPGGVEVFLDEGKRTWTDGADFEEKKQTVRGEGDRERSIARAARRAKTQVRRRCKMISADCMITLTYRENMTDLKRLQRDFKAFCQRLKALGPFEYVACVEKQQRGALHIHLACQSFPAWMQSADGVRVKSFNLLRSIWHRIVGRDNGNIDVTKPRGRNSPHRIASYIAKYVSKAIEGAVFNAKTYWSSRGIHLPTPTRLWFEKNTPTWDIISMLTHDFCLRGYLDIAQYSDRMNEFYWFSASKVS